MDMIGDVIGLIIGITFVAILIIPLVDMTIPKDRKRDDQ